MPKVKITAIPGVPNKTISVNTGDSIQSVIDKVNLFHDASFLLNGEILDDDFDVSYPLGEHDILTIIDQPKGGFSRRC